ncbi:MAG: proton-conducting transporter membrane subunit [Candidatus Omnitrophica bacterium]|nr:proton-conducting transporter membrane subunit [Candidatus Omnitrophota bacterium]
MDLLSLFFILVIFLLSLPCAVYSVGYLKTEASGKAKALAWVLLILFVASMALVVTARNVIVFLVAWELMSLVSYFLVVFDSTQEKSIQAGTIYIVMTHLGTAFLIVAFLIMSKYAHSFDFLAIKAACALMPANIKNIVFLCLFIGFGTKAGLVPLHIWLPFAHPQAPSHISALMSGVMIKTAIYGIIRFIIMLLGVASIWWGVWVLCFALLSCLVGVIYALMEHDIKKLLAYHSVENIGIILLGVGLAMVFIKLHLDYLAVFALVAGLYHLVNHAIFKGLLFLCSGSVYKATGTRDIEKLGGLIKNMPITSACFLVGAMAISALPPLNGFISEWLTLQAFFLGAGSVGSGGKLFLGISAALLALTSGLAAACFVKAFGIIFLAKPRSRQAQNASEVSFSMKSAMVFLSLLTVLFGLAAGIIIRLLTKICTFVLEVNASGPQPGNGIYLSSPLLALVIIVLGLAGFCAYFLFAKKPVRIYETWGCGYYKLDSRNEYTATAFSKVFRIAFSFFLLPYSKTQKIRESFYHVKSFSYETHTTPVFRKYIYAPAVKLIFRSAKFGRRMQPGSIHLYLGYIFVTLLLLLVFMHKF